MSKFKKIFYGIGIWYKSRYGLYINIECKLQTVKCYRINKNIYRNIQSWSAVELFGNNL